MYFTNLFSVSEYHIPGLVLDSFVCIKFKASNSFKMEETIILEWSP